MKFFNALERRALLSGTIVDGVIVIDGTEKADYIFVLAGVVNNKLTVSINSHEQRFDMTGVTGMRIEGSGGGDILDATNSPISVTLLGGNGRDRLRGSHYADNLLSGGRGRDTLHGGNYHDVLIGGRDNDHLLGAIRGTGTYNADGSTALDAAASLTPSSRLYGGAGDDLLEGGNGKDYLSAGVGNDTLRGGYGNDRLFGGDGNDTLDDTAGKDTFHGGEGNDSLYAAGADDELLGGPGTDSMNFEATLRAAGGGV